MIVKTTLFRGISTPVSEIQEQIAHIGWETSKVKWDKKLGEYTAEARNPHGERVMKTGPDEATALGNLLMAVSRLHNVRSAAQYKVGMWSKHWGDKQRPIAEAYAQAPVYDPKAAVAFKELGDDSVRRLKVLQKHIHIEPTNDPHPYADAKEMSDDVHDKQHLHVTTAGLDHPLWNHEQALAFRAVHDILGHAVSGGGFDWHGSNLAATAHMPLLTPTAQQALFSEVIGQNAYASHYRNHGPQKIALFPEFMDHHQESENPMAYTGIHPSQVLPPVRKPGLTSSFIRKYANGLMDPNAGWSSGYEPMQVATHGVGNAYLDHGDPLQSDAVMDNAALIDTKWHSLTKADGSFDRERASLAIVNAFRVVLLSPRKDLSWNAKHYQDISHIPSSTDDPKQYWDALESRRRSWNKAQGIDENAHMIYFKFLKPFRSIIQSMNPDLSYEQAHDKAERTLFSWWSEEQSRIETDDEKKPADKQKSADEIERRANEALARRLKLYIDDKRNVKTDADAPVHEPMSLFGKTAAGGQYNLMTGEEANKYGAFMGTHLKSISQISQHANDILEAALEDVKAHDATGHHFRAHVLSLNISGVGPKVCSFAWLLLQPLTSQLATIDTHMMDVLGHHYEKEMNNRDYFCFTPENLVRTESGWTPISDIAPGERVLTNSGTFEKVEKVLKREYTGPLVEVKTPVGVSPIRMTPEHPILKLSGLHKRLDHKNVCSPQKCRVSEHLHELVWANADSLNNKSHMVSRVIDESQASDIDLINLGGRTVQLTNDLLWIIGLYLAEGSVSDRVIQFSLHKKETIYQSRVIAFFQKELNLRVTYSQPREDYNGVQLLIYSADLARAFSSMFGQGAKNKSIPADLLNLPADRLSHIFDGIHAGDGCDLNSTLGQTSPMLALQVTEYLLRNGKMPSNSTWNDDDPNHSSVYVTQYAEPRVHKNKRGFWNLNGECLVQTTVSSSEYQGYVYNLEVEGDHTYVVQNVVVHNCFERELAAGRDSSGYGHVPLGAFQWGMWDYKRTGAGSHQDHSAMRVLDPVPHQDIDWASKANNLKGESWLQQAPDWWKNTQEARDAVAKQWHATDGKGVPQGAIPYQVDPNAPVTSKVHESGDGSLDEFHVGVSIPEEIVQDLTQIAKDLNLKDPDDAADYHVTAFWSEHGYDNKELHDWIEKASISGFRFENAYVESFKSHKGNYAIVLKFDAPEAKVLVTELMDQAEDRGLDIKRFDGGWKPHITLGFQDDEVKGQKFPEISFRSGPLYVSIPRPLRKTADMTAIINPTLSKLQAAKIKHPGLSTQEIWEAVQDDPQAA
jgi:hypothetical protein